jgi:hypothetical protein
MTDKELLELAAKAAEIDIFCWAGHDVGCFSPVVLPDGLSWNPLTEDRDAFRLQVELEIELWFGPTYVMAGKVQETTTNDPFAATRRAITRAAAEIGKEMK